MTNFELIQEAYRADLKRASEAGDGALYAAIMLDYKTWLTKNTNPT